ncbi:hypothetical protein HDU92_007760 [Lobulomyces angularis]|nr:hypothetical protein HDU92_007760 [Lobulomyces angularis]
MLEVYISNVDKLDCEISKIPSLLYRLMNKIYNVSSEHKVCIIYSVEDNKDKLQHIFLFPFIDKDPETLNKLFNDKYPECEVKRNSKERTFKDIIISKFYNKDVEHIKKEFKIFDSDEVEKFISYIKDKHDISPVYYSSVAVAARERITKNVSTDIMTYSSYKLHNALKALEKIDISKQYELCDYLKYFIVTSNISSKFIDTLDKEMIKLIDKGEPRPCSMIQLNAEIEKAIIEYTGTHNSTHDQYEKLLKVYEYHLQSTDHSSEYITYIMFDIIFSLKLVRTDKNKWYYYEQLNHGWIKVDDDFVYKLINTNFINIVSTCLNGKYKKYVLEILNKNIRMNDLFNRIKLNMLDSDFHKILDTSQIFRFKDGVYDLNKMIFREGRKTDFTSMCSNSRYNFPRYYNEQQISDANEKMLLILKQVFPNDEVREYFLLYVASLFDIGNKEKIFIVFYGAGYNAKTLMVNIIAKMLGTYSQRPPVSQIIGNTVPSSSGANSDWMILDKVRVAIYVEPDCNGGKFNKAIIKFMTGGDGKMSGRALYENFREIDINIKPIICANFDFNIGIADSAMAKRTVVIPFNSLFTKDKNLIKDEYKNDEQHIYLMDENLRSNIDDITISFQQLILKEYYPKYKKNGLQINSSIKKATLSFLNKGDPVAHFLAAKTYYDIEKTYINNETRELSTTLLHEMYRGWYEINYPNKKPLDLTSFLSIVESKDYKIENGIVCNLIMLKNTETKNIKKKKSVVVKSTTNVL